MSMDASFIFRLRRRTGVILAGFALAMLLLFPFIPPQLAALFNLALVVVANLLGFWRWGLAATAYTVLITWLIDELAWQAGFGPEVYITGGLFNLGLTLVFGTALAAKNRQVVTDGLTGLYNDSHFRAALEWEVRKAQRYGRKLALLMIDLDGFKRLNDHHGHLAGDQVLREVAEAIGASCRDCDLAARYGGDEFAVILPETDLPGARETARRLAGRIEAKRWQHQGADMTVGVSIGTAELHPGQSAEALVREADRALYVDKNRRREQESGARQPNDR